MSYDYDGIEVDLENGTFTIFIDNIEYTYTIENEMELLLGADDNGVTIHYTEIDEAEPEDIDEYYGNWNDSESDSEEDY